MAPGKQQIQRSAEVNKGTSVASCRAVREVVSIGTIGQPTPPNYYVLCGDGTLFLEATGIGWGRVNKVLSQKGKERKEREGGCLFRQPSPALCTHTKKYPHDDHDERESVDDERTQPNESQLLSLSPSRLRGVVQIFFNKIIRPVCY